MMSLLRRLCSYLIGVLKCAIGKVDQLLPIKAKHLIAKNVVLVVLNAVFVLWFSFILTWLFRYWLLPLDTVMTKDLHFEFKSCESHGVCSYPSANISSAIYNGVPFFTRGIRYNLLMSISLPDCPVNRNLGMVLTQLKLVGSKGSSIRSIQRTMLVKYQSMFLRYVKLIIFLPLYVVGLLDEMQIVVVNFADEYEENAYNPSLFVHFEIQSTAIQIENAQFTAKAAFFGLRNFIYSWPLFSSLLFFWFVLAVFCSLFALVWIGKAFQFYSNVDNDFDQIIDNWEPEPKQPQPYTSNDISSLNDLNKIFIVANENQENIRFRRRVLTK